MVNDGGRPQGDGVAGLGNMEAIQFHPTGIFPAGILVTEGCRGDGGLLRDVDGYRFMPDVEPEKKELASRDVVSRRMEERIAQGKGVHSKYGDHLWLDITLLGEHHIKHNLREVYDICHYFLGVDPIKEWIPVRPAQHYTMGGIRTDYRGESRQLKGLFAAGECACWDMHGFNRLGGNSVAETVVAGMIVGEFIADFCEKPENEIDLPTSIVYDFARKVQDELNGFLHNTGNEDAVKIRTRMQEIMTSKIGIFRNEKQMSEAVDELQQLLERSYNISVKNDIGNNPQLVYAYRTRKMLKVALTRISTFRRWNSRRASAVTVPRTTSRTPNLSVVRRKWTTSGPRWKPKARIALQFRMPLCLMRTSSRSVFVDAMNVPTNLLLTN